MEHEGYKTRTLNIAAYLYAAGLKLKGTAKVNGEVFFIFIPQEKAEELVQNYFSNNASVNPKELFARLNDLRDLIFAGGRNG